jgi:hypothetical protein
MNSFLRWHHLFDLGQYLKHGMFIHSRRTWCVWGMHDGRPI